MNISEYALALKEQRKRQLNLNEDEEAPPSPPSDTSDPDDGFTRLHPYGNAATEYKSNLENENVLILGRDSHFSYESHTTGTILMQEMTQLDIKSIHNPAYLSWKIMYPIDKVGPKISFGPDPDNPNDGDREIISFNLKSENEVNDPLVAILDFDSVGRILSVDYPVKVYSDGGLRIDVNGSGELFELDPGLREITLNHVYKGIITDSKITFEFLPSVNESTPKIFYGLVTYKVNDVSYYLEASDQDVEFTSIWVPTAGMNAKLAFSVVPTKDTVFDVIIKCFDVNDNVLSEIIVDNCLSEGTDDIKAAFAQWGYFSKVFYVSPNAIATSIQLRLRSTSGDHSKVLMGGLTLLSEYPYDS